MLVATGIGDKSWTNHRFPSGFRSVGTSSWTAPFLCLDVRAGECAEFDEFRPPGDCSCLIGFLFDCQSRNSRFGTTDGFRPIPQFRRCSDDRSAGAATLSRSGL